MRTSLSQAEASARPLELLVRTGLLLSQERDLQKIVQGATDAGRELCGAQFGAFFYNVIDAAGDRYRLYTTSGVPVEEFSKFPMPRITALFQPTFAGAGIVRSGDVTQDPRYGRNGPLAGMPKGHLPVRSYLAVPVTSRAGEVLGALLYGHSETDAFGPETEELVQTVAAQAAIAIENFRLHEQLTRQIADVETAQRQQQKEARRVLEVLETTSDAVFVLDREWNFQLLNSNALEILSPDRGLLGQNIRELLPGFAGSAFWLNCQAVMSDRQAREFEQFYAPRGLWLAVRAYASEEGIVVFFRDVTSIRENERKVEESSRRLRLALEAGQLGIWTWDAQTDVLDLDERAAALFNCEPHQPVTRSEVRERIVVPEDRRRTRDAMRKALETGSSYTSEYRVLRADGGHAWVISHGVATFEEHDGQQHKVTGMVGTLQDITARKQQEDALRQSEKLAATGRMAATIAHEINNPLEAVTNLIYLAKTSPDAPVSVQKQLEIADQELERVAQIAQQTLGFYRDTSRPVQIDLAEAARDVIAIFQRKLQYKQLQCDLQVRGHVELTGLQGELRQAISNLLVNAIDASTSPGTIILRIRNTRIPITGAPGVSILVADRGTGIPHSVRGNLFSPFFTTKREVGTGLGLWVTKGIIEKHGGTIRFRSRAEGATGTVFRTLIPNVSLAATETREDRLQ